MKLSIERWIEGLEVSKDANDLMKEAVLCYKSSAYRASMLFSYLCFQTIVKDRLLESDIPQNIHRQRWEDILKKIRNDDTWDREVFDCIQANSERSKVFNISDDLRNQVTFWKNRRNDCAHSKNNKVDYAHVESFWLFMTSNIGKFVVNGSREALLNKIKNHFDLRLTPKGKDSTFLVQEISNVIESEKLQDFMEDLVHVLREVRPYINSDEDIYDFLNKLFNSEKEDVIKAFIQCIKGKQEMVLQLFDYYPNRIVYFADDHHFIRNLWYEKLTDDPFINALTIYCGLLRNNLIPQEEVEESMKHIMFMINPEELKEMKNLDILNEFGFFQIFKKVCFVGDFLGPKINDYDFANKHKGLITMYLKINDLDEKVVGVLCNLFSDETYHPWKLRESLLVLFSENPCKKEEFESITLEKGFDLPGALGFVTHNV